MRRRGRGKEGGAGRKEQHLKKSKEETIVRSGDGEV